MSATSPFGLQLLASASRTLFASLNYEQTLVALSRLLVPAMAEWCVVDVVENGALRRVHVAHVRPEMEQLAREIDSRYPPQFDASFGQGKVVHTLAPDLVSEIPDALVKAASRDEEHYKLLKQFDLACILSVPMLAQGQAVGVITLIRNSKEPAFDESDIALLQEVALRAAIAVRNAQITRALELQSERLRIAQRAAKIGTFEFEVATGKAYWSEELYDVIGFDRTIAPDFALYMSHIHPDDQARVNQLLQEQLNSPSNHVQYEYRMTGMDGKTRFVTVHGTMMRDGAGNPQRMMGIIMDVTERKLVESALLESERMAAAGRVAASLAHEINNPIAAITNLVYLANKADSLEEAKSYLGTAEQELRRVAQVAAQSLRYYRNQAHEACDMRESIGSAVTVLRRKIEAKGIQLRNEVRHAASLGCSEFEFRQIVLNLLGNAIDAVEPLGTVAIRSYQRNGNVELLISDDGPGIAESVHGRLFEPFVTSKGAAGTGLGLWITKGLVTKHGGSLRVRSSRAVRRGTTFRVSFPVAKAGAAAKAN